MDSSPGSCSRARPRRLPAARPLLVVLLAAWSAVAGRAQEEPVDPEALKRLSLEQLMEIDVTSVSKRSERLSQAAAAVTVITGDVLRRSGATSLPEVLRLVVGLHVAQSDARAWAVSARGFNSTTADKMLVLVDGRSVYTPLFSGVFWDVQDTLLADVDRIEVIRGPGATLWGANAVNGVINIITKSAAETQGGLTAAAAGSEERGFAGARYGGALGAGGHYRAYAKVLDRDALVRADGAGAGNPTHRGQGGFRVDAGPSDADALTLQGDLYSGSVGEPPFGTDDVEGGNLLGRWRHRLAGGSDLRLQVYYDRTHRNIPNLFAERRDTWDLDLQHHFQWGGRHDVVWGAGFRTTSDQVVDSAIFQWVPAHRTSELWNLFAQDEIALAHDLHFTIGSKFEHNDSTGLEVQPGLRLSWTPDGRHTLWGAISRAVRTPTRLDEDVRVTVGPQVILVGNRDFRSEELLAYELGYRVQLAAPVSFDVATFYNVYDRLRSQEPSPGGGLPLTFANELNAETYGAELRATLQVETWWRLVPSYAYFAKRLRLDPGSHDSSGGTAEGDDPRSRFNLRSSMDLPHRIELDGLLRYVGALPAPAVPAYVELDLRLGWWPTERLELALVGQNLLHAHHPEFGPPGPARNEVQRGAYGKVAWRF
jgi:iron complex outermembrane recepter protein